MEQDGSTMQGYPFFAHAELAVETRMFTYCAFV